MLKTTAVQFLHSLLCPSFLLPAALLCAYTTASVLAADFDAEKKQIESVLDKQCSAWNNGKLDEFMQAYLQSPQTSYTSGAKEVWGYEALRERYLRKYGDKPETMGQVLFSDLKTIKLGDNNALVIGHWHLSRKGPPDIDGVFSLVLSKTDGGWKIIHDHTSVAEKVEEKKQ